MLKMSTVILATFVVAGAVQAQAPSSDVTKFGLSADSLAPASGTLNAAPAASPFTGADVKFSAGLNESSNAPGVPSIPSMAMNSGMTPPPAGGPLAGLAADLTETRFGAQPAGQTSEDAMQKFTALVPVNAGRLGLDISNTAGGSQLNASAFGTNSGVKLGK